ncbi:hypothetical protein AVEN_182501-1 [Araneus ventricosus]|uniref:Uncharacterized protein n=1 Tax=Araneus ventricosus TaxID=182803 RepID=A0A4Y2BXL6_ARAVE|nr:hypothetical protein AVEN_182501-1 [Araneus ventricosus]
MWRWHSGKVSALGLRVPDSKSSYTKDPPCMLQVKSYLVAKRPPVGVVWKFGEEGCQLRCRPRHLTAVRNYEVCPKIALVLPQNLHQIVSTFCSANYPLKVFALFYGHPAYSLSESHHYPGLLFSFLAFHPEHKNYYGFFPRAKCGFFPTRSISSKNSIQWLASVERWTQNPDVTQVANPTNRESPHLEIFPTSGTVSRSLVIAPGAAEEEDWK